MRHLRPSRRVSAGKSWLKQQIPNVKSITERWRFTWRWEFLLSKTLYLSSCDCVKWSLSLKLSKGKGFCLFYWPFIVHSCFTSCIFAARTLEFAVKFRFVFRSLALLSIGLLRKFEAYLVYLSLIWSKNPRCFSFFSKIPPFHLYVAMVSPCHPQFSRANWWHAQSFFSSVWHSWIGIYSGSL